MSEKQQAPQPNPSETGGGKIQHARTHKLMGGVGGQLKNAMIFGFGATLGGDFANSLFQGAKGEFEEHK